MTRDDDFIGQLEGYLDEFEGMTPLPDAIRDALRRQLPTIKQIGPFTGLMRYLSMSTNLPTSVRYGMVAAVAVVAVVLGAALFSRGPNVGNGPEVTATPTAIASPTAPAKAYDISIPELSGLHVSLTLPEGWGRYAWYVAKNDANLGLYPVDNVYSDPCHWSGSLLDPPVGPTVDDLATALANQLTRHATATDVTLGGYSGKLVRMSVPADINLADCDNGLFGSWSESGSGDPSRYSQGPGQLDDIYIIDVQGVRVVIDSSYLPSTAPTDVAELEGLLASLIIQP